MDPEEVWVMAGLARRLLVTTIDGTEHRSTEHGRFHAEAHPGETSIEIVLACDADAAKLALGGRDPAGQRWRDAWLLQIVRGDDRWLLEFVAASRSALRAVARSSRSCECVGAMWRMSRSSMQHFTDPRGNRRSPTRSPTETWCRGQCRRAEVAPWWEIDLGKPMCIVWMRIDLAPLPPGTRITCHAFGHPAPSGARPAGSVIAEISRDALHVIDEQAWFTVDESVVARYVRVQVHALDGETVALAITAAEIQAAELHAETLAQTMRRAFVLHCRRTLCLSRSVDGYESALRYDDMWARATALSRSLAARLEPSDERIVVAIDLAIIERGLRGCGTRAR
jgi:hypothetical protein